MFFVSPFERTRETYRELRAALHDSRVIRVREEPRIRELEFGNFQNSAAHATVDEERSRYGRFFFRMPMGESGADVYDRVSAFIETLHRTFHGDGFEDDTNVIIVTHGLTLRLFLMRFFHWSVETFESTSNPGNAQYVIMNRLCGTPKALGRGSYELAHESAAVIGLRPEQCGDPLIQSEERRPTAGNGAAARPM